MLDKSVRLAERSQYHIQKRIQAYDTHQRQQHSICDIKDMLAGRSFFYHFIILSLQRIPPLPQAGFADLCAELVYRYHQYEVYQRIKQTHGRTETKV